MRRVLIPVDGSPEAEAAVRAVVAQARCERVAAIHVINVQPPLHAYLARFVPRAEWRRMRTEAGREALAGACRVLDRAGLDYRTHLRVGRVSETVAAAAAALRVDEIVMAVEGGFVSTLRLWFTVARVRRHAGVPVVVVMSPKQAAAFDLPFGRRGSPAPR
ncbi:MAG: universal stress protein [Rhodospirillaceae bacterium]|nr:universal stress protein [Rhodospirillaceae bacterium]